MKYSDLFPYLLDAVKNIVHLETRNATALKAIDLIDAMFGHHDPTDDAQAWELNVASNAQDNLRELIVPTTVQQATTNPAPANP